MTSAVDCVVHNARLIGRRQLQTISVRSGIVESIQPSDNDTSDFEQAASASTIDAQGSLAVAGLTDLYARLREPGQTRKGTISSEAAAARRAGFTRIVCSPDTVPVVDSVATVEWIRQRAAKDAAGVKIVPMAALTIALEGEQLSELATLQSAGCAVASQADQPILNTSVLYSAMEYARSFNMPLIMTARDAHIGSTGSAHSGATATRLGLPQTPIAAETVALATLVELCQETECRLHVSRLSSARAVHQIADAKQSGLPITCDVGIHHLFYTDELLAGYDATFHSAVPFRGHEDRQALREGVAQGVIDAICSDHAPHDKDAHLAPFADTEPGLSAYDWFIPLLMQLPTITGLSIQAVFDKLTKIPSLMLGDGESSEIAIGERANFFLLAPDERPAAPGSIYSAGKNNPLMLHAAETLGLPPLAGRVKAVITEANMTRYE
ncbi:MAG: amidohydrolase family protein [Granulosicoccus sp.]|nr:amidohydrolase family protein [Granulosicoccus sp.]